MLYITLGDQPSGIYEGQVIDVCLFLGEHFNKDVRLLSLISLRDFKKNKAKIKAKYPKAIVLPMVPKLKNWKLNSLTIALVCRYYKEQVVIGRNVLATNAALYLKKLGILKKVIFDGRGAIAAEWEEYEVVGDEKLKRQIEALENAAILKADFRLAVSNTLVQYWKNRYGYSSDQHVVIPCTVSRNFKTKLLTEKELVSNKLKAGYSLDDIVLVYAGSTAGWQSFNLLKDFLSPLLAANKRIKVLFLSKEDKNSIALKETFPGQVRIQWVQSEEVSEFLSVADYGILLREKSVTNEVASPTKFAEYLISGLSVLISPKIGDFSKYVTLNNCGLVVNEKKEIYINQISYQERIQNNKLARTNFLKESALNFNSYQKLLGLELPLK